MSSFLRHWWVIRNSSFPEGSLLLEALDELVERLLVLLDGLLRPEQPDGDGLLVVVLEDDVQLAELLLLRHLRVRVERGGLEQQRPLDVLVLALEVAPPSRRPS